MTALRFEGELSSFNTTLISFSSSLRYLSEKEITVSLSAVNVTLSESKCFTRSRLMITPLFTRTNCFPASTVSNRFKLKCGR